MYSRGSNAYDLYSYQRGTAAPAVRPAAAPRPVARPQQTKTLQRKNRTVANKTTRKKLAKNQIKLVFTMACIIVLAAMVVFSYAQNNILTNRINSLKSQATLLEGEVAQMNVAMERSIDLKRIEEVAVNEYGMQRPEKYQKVFIEVNQPDTAVTVAKNENGVKNKVTAAFQNIMEYLF